jgi:branched-chain amino acid aminotransferase
VSEPTSPSPSAQEIPALASIDGTISPSAQAQIAVTDEGLIRGDGVFEVIRLYKGRPFALADHLDRIETSANFIDLPVDRGPIEAEIETLLAQFGDFDAQLRIVLTRGGRRILLTEPIPPRGDTVRLAVVTYQPTVILTGAKTLSYAANMQATRLAKAAGEEEALLVTPQGVLLEAPTSTLFFASGGKLKTPRLEDGILASITRARLVDVLDVEQGSYTADDARGADEAFLASTTREIQPVAAIDGTPLPAAPGPLTTEATAAFASVIQKEL